MTVSPEAAEAYLECCALGYAESVRSGDAAQLEAWTISKATLHDAGVQLAAALGSLDAGERAELVALRRLRDGIVALRDEMTEGRAFDGDEIADADARYYAASTISALLVLHAPTNGAQQ